MLGIASQDDGGHRPGPDGDERWQESWSLLWYDPWTRSGSFHHIGLQRPRGIADVWSWVAAGDQVVGRFQHLDLPLPESDLPHLELPGLRINSKEPLRSQRVEADVDGASVDVMYTAFTPPISFSMDGHDADLGRDHYDSLGRISGTVTAGGGTFEVDGYAFHDHSWGPREYSKLLAHRWVWATFGEDLCLSVLSFTTPGGRQDFGWIFDHDRFHQVRRIEGGFTVADDGHSPVACDTRFWTDTGRGYHLRGEVRVGSTWAEKGGFFATDGLSTFEMGGRLGSGNIELRELDGPAPWHHDQYGFEV
jgi:hypothetical protein